MRHGAVLVLAALGAADDVDAGRVVLEAHRRLDLVHVLPALAAGAHRRGLEIGVLDLDVDLVLDVGRDIDGHEARLPPPLESKGQMRTKRCTPTSGAQVAVGVGATDRERCAVDARVVTDLIVEDLDLVAPWLAPAGVHAQEHVRPALGVCPARARVNADDRVGVIGRTPQHALSSALRTRRPSTRPCSAASESALSSSSAAHSSRNSAPSFTSFDRASMPISFSLARDRLRSSAWAFA